MANKFLKVSRGFSNSAVYFRVPEEKVDEATSKFAQFEDENPGCWTAWVSGAGLGGVAVDWVDRMLAGC